VSFYGAFYAESKIWFLLEYMDCGTLGDVIKRGGPMPENVLSKIASQV
jgi:serine/threonine protein kinase